MVPKVGGHLELYDIHMHYAESCVKHVANALDFSQMSMTNEVMWLRAFYYICDRLASVKKFEFLNLAEVRYGVDNSGGTVTPETGMGPGFRMEGGNGATDT